MKFHGKAVYIIGQHFSSSVLKKLIRTDKSKESVQEVLPYILSSGLSARTHIQEMSMQLVYPGTGHLDIHSQRKTSLQWTNMKV